MATTTTRKKKKDEERGKVGKITNPRMQTQEGPMTKPSGGSGSAHTLTAREIAAYKRRSKRAAKKKKDNK